MIHRKLVMDAAHVREKLKIIRVAIDALKERYPNEVPYVYKPMAGEKMSLPPREEFQKEYYSSFSLDL